MRNYKTNSLETPELRNCLVAQLPPPQKEKQKQKKMEMLHSPCIKPSPLSRAQAAMRMVSASQAWLGKAARHREPCNAPQSFLPISVLQLAGAERRKSEQWLWEGVFPPQTQPAPFTPAKALPKHPALQGWSDLLPGLHWGVSSPPAAHRKGTLAKTCPFCPTFNLSQHCWGPAQSPSRQIKLVVEETGSFGSHRYSLAEEKMGSWVSSDSGLGSEIFVSGLTAGVAGPPRLAEDASAVLTVA